jgi:hypothetical protein
LALLAQNSSSSTTKKQKPLNGNIKRLESMIQLRKLIVAGEDYDSIQQQLKISRRTFFRYLKKVFESDKKALEEGSHDELMHQISILTHRYTRIFQRLQSIGDDEGQTAEDRMQALHAAASIAYEILNIYRNAPVKTIIQRRKLAALKEGVPFSEDGMPLQFRPPSMYDYPPWKEPHNQQQESSQQPYPTITPSPPQQQSSSRLTEKEEERERQYA